MNAKKWVLTFLLLALVLVLGLAAFNYVTDPFAAFGDKFGFPMTRRTTRASRRSAISNSTTTSMIPTFWAVLRPVRCKSQTSTNFTTQISII